MTRVRAMLELAERAEQATGPDRVLNADIARVLRHGLAYAAGDRAWNFTGSLDAAMTLVPEGWHLSDLCENWLKRTWKCDLAKLPNDGQRRAYESGKVIGIDSERSEGATTPALALCAAALRALAADTPKVTPND